MDRVLRFLLLLLFSTFVGTVIILHFHSPILTFVVISALLSLVHWEFQRIVRRDFSEANVQVFANPPVRSRIRQVLSLIRRLNPGSGDCFCAQNSGPLVMVSCCQKHFHPLCLLKWLMRNGSCPYCRAELVGGEPISDSETEEQVPEPEAPPQAEFPNNGLEGWFKFAAITLMALVVYVVRRKRMQ